MQQSFTEVVTKALGIEGSSFVSENNEVIKYYNDCSSLMGKLKQKFIVSNFYENIQILPNSRIMQTVNFFLVTEYLVKEA